MTNNLGLSYISEILDGSLSLSPEDKVIYTLGSSDRGAEEFISLLKGHWVEVVVDVRRFPTSKFPHFRREELARLLEQEGIGYIYLGDQLGGYRRGGYEAYTRERAFQEGVDRVEGIVRTWRTAILCAERLPWRCHRRFIAAEMERRGWRVVHILDTKRIWAPKEINRS